MSVVNEPKQFRENIVNNLFSKLIDNVVISKNLEIGIFNYTIKLSKKKKIIRKWENSYFVQLYVDRVRSIYNNISNKETGLLKKLIEKKISPKTLAFMSHQEMYNKKWKKLIEAKIKRDKNLTEDDLSAATDEFKCFKCKKKKMFILSNAN